MFWNTMYLQLLEYPNQQVDDKQNRWNCEDISVQDPMFLFSVSHWSTYGPIKCEMMIFYVSQWEAFLSCCKLYKWVHNRIELEQHSLDGFLYLTKFQEVNEEQFLDYSKFQDLGDWLLKDLLISGSKCLHFKIPTIFKMSKLLKSQYSRMTAIFKMSSFQNFNDFQNVNIWKCPHFGMSTIFQNVNNFSECPQFSKCPHFYRYVYWW